MGKQNSRRIQKRYYSDKDNVRSAKQKFNSLSTTFNKKQHPPRKTSNAKILAKEFIHYSYPGIVERIVDGDTMILFLDRGFGDISSKTIRLARIDCPETRGKDKAAGKAAQQKVTELIPTGSSVFLISNQLDSWGRSIGEIYFVQKGVVKNLSDTLVTEGHATYKDYSN